MRRKYDGQLQRHFAGQVDAVDGATVRATGYVFIYDDDKAQYVKKESQRTTILDLAESGYIVNFIPSNSIWTTFGTKISIEPILRSPTGRVSFSTSMSSIHGAEPLPHHLA